MEDGFSKSDAAFYVSLQFIFMISHRLRDIFRADGAICLICVP